MKFIDRIILINEAPEMIKDAVESMIKKYDDCWIGKNNCPCSSPFISIDGRTSDPDNTYNVQEGNLELKESLIGIIIYKETV